MSHRAGVFGRERWVCSSTVTNLKSPLAPGERDRCCGSSAGTHQVGFTVPLARRWMEGEGTNQIGFNATIALPLFKDTPEV